MVGGLWQGLRSSTEGEFGALAYTFGMGQFEISLLAIGVVIPVLLAYRFYGRLAPVNNGASPGEVARRPTISAASAVSHNYTLEFFRLLLKETNSKTKKQLNSNLPAHWRDLLEDPDLYPRQPMILPKLLQAMRSTTTNSNALVNIVLEDPGLTSEVLKLANSPLYRNTRTKVHSVDYALVMLGVDGLHALICSTLTKPIFSQQKDDRFNAASFWEWSLLSAQHAQTLAQLNQVSTPTVPYMLTLLTRLAELTCLRLCHRIAFKEEAQEEAQQATLDPDQVMALIEAYRLQIAKKLILDWGFDQAWCELLPTPEQTHSLQESSEAHHIKRAQRLAPELSSAAILLKQNRVEEAQVSADFKALGLTADSLRKLLHGE